jgi:hypothetical protein
MNQQTKIKKSEVVMKTKYLFIALLVTFAFLLTEEAYSYKRVVSIGYFYSELSPYGRWIEIDPGVVVWRPANSFSKWAPYSAGTWVWTNYGWYWDSYEPYGHVVYHYGRWYFDDYYGWLWLPDYEWAPSWVEWRYNDVYIGWAPLHPYAAFSIATGIHFTKSYYVKYSYWNYVKYAHFCNSNVNNYFIGETVKYRIHSDTKYRSNYEYRNNGVYNRGVDPALVERRGNTRVKENNIVFKQREDNSRDPVVRSNGRIEVATPRESSVRNENLVFEKRERASSLDVTKVEMGRRESSVNRENTVNRESTTNRESVRSTVNQTRQNETDNTGRTRTSESVRTETRNNENTGRNTQVQQRSEVQSSATGREATSSTINRAAETQTREQNRSVETQRTETRSNISTGVQRETETNINNRTSTPSNTNVNRERNQSTTNRGTGSSTTVTGRTQTENRTTTRTETRRGNSSTQQRDDNSNRETRTRTR